MCPSPRAAPQSEAWPLLPALQQVSCETLFEGLHNQTEGSTKSRRPVSDEGPETDMQHASEELLLGNRLAGVLGQTHEHGQYFRLQLRGGAVPGGSVQAGLDQPLPQAEVASTDSLLAS